MGSKRPNLNWDKLEVGYMKKKKMKEQETKLGTSIIISFCPSSTVISNSNGEREEAPNIKIQKYHHK